MKYEHESKAYARALAAEHRLHSIERMVDVQVMFVRRNDTFCSACYWEQVLKPLMKPLVGWSRGDPQQAKDPDDTSSLKAVDLVELMAQRDDRPPAETDTERWMRTTEAWDAVSDRHLQVLHGADPGHGCGFCRATRRNGSKSA